LRVMDIALVPEHRGRGIGGVLMHELLSRARAEGRSVSIHVEMNNPAMRLYERLGFRQIDSYGIYHLMEWQPDAAPAS
ncbi:MAG: GNAT family N-acetyltransferase, partial [Thermoanaerobaculia bacterium]